MLCKKCKEPKTTGARAVLESHIGLEDQRLSPKIKIEPAPKAVALEHFFALFTRRDKYIEKLPGRDWQWKKTLLHDFQIAGVISDAGRGLHRGCAWAHKTRFGVIDIDQGSKYRSPHELADLTAKFAAVNLNLVPYQSSDSGGWHLYFFLEEWAESDEVNSTIKAWLKANNYEIRGGILEVFPSGQGLRLPLQRGFAWLDPSGKVITTREELEQDEALTLFLADLEFNQTNWQKAKELIEAQLQLTWSAGAGSALAHKKRVAVEGTEDLFTSGIDWEKYHKGREYWLYGLTGANQRHDAVCSIGHYLWYGDSSQGVRALPYPNNAGARAELILEWLKEKHNGFSETINLGQWSEVEAQVQRACYWTAKGSQVKQRESYPITERLVDRLCETQLTPDDFRKANRRKEGAARSKIKRALAQCIDEGSQVTRNRLALISGCSPNTVSKHADLWGLLSTGSHAYITGGLGGSCAEVVQVGSSVLDFEPSCLNPLEPEFEISDRSSSVRVFDFPVLELAPICFMVFDSLRLKISGATANNSTAMVPNDLLAATSCDFSYGVKHWRKQSLHVGEASGMVCSLNGFLPTLCAGPLHLPQTAFFMALCARSCCRSEGTDLAAIFYMELLYANLTAIVLAEHLEPVFFNDS